MRRLALGLLLASLPTAEPSFAAESPQLPNEALVLPPVARYGRSAVPIDPIQAKLAAGQWGAPKEGDTVAGVDGKDRTWVKMAVKNGAINHSSLNGGYAFFRVTSPSDRIMLLESAGSTTTIVNGEPRVGDIYQHGYVTVPVALRKGENEFLFHCGRGSLRAKLLEPKGRAQFHLADMTLPDLVVGQPVSMDAGIIVLNSSNVAADRLAIATTIFGSKSAQVEAPTIPPASLRKVPVRLVGEAPKAAGKVAVAIRLLAEEGGTWKELDAATIHVDAKDPTAMRRETFISQIDGSVQYYALVPAKPDGDKKPGLVLTLHGAGVEGLGQAACFTPKAGLHVVAPTNRRPFGFDWEDWGRWDALEVLERVQKDLKTDPARTYLTGHSMGGHGTWHLGVTFPDRFAAIGPSAGWVSMASYAGAKRSREPSAIEELVQRATNASDTLSLSRNYATHGVFILHGDKDDNVPVSQARTMRKALSEFHPDFVYREQPGAGHWWGNACVDWGPMFEFFQARRIPPRDAVNDIAFLTASPGVSADCYWTRIEAQRKPMALSGIKLRRDKAKRQIEGSTDNVMRLALDLSGMEPGRLNIQLDGQQLADEKWPAATTTIVLSRTSDTWSVSPPATPNEKGPARYGPFKEAFRQRMMFVYGTKGTPDENAWALVKARFDAEQFWYRGNGSIEVIPDTSFDAMKDPHRNVILYGNADTNRAWKALLNHSPIQVRRGSIDVGGREEQGDALAALFIRPRPGSDTALVGAVSGTGVEGMRVTDRLPYFVSGVGYPDWLMIDSGALKTGISGVRGAGYFGMDWRLESGEAAWRKK